ncbi:MAG: phospholipid carrier-dependent glycosyltransferase [Myxococcales bacterium]|nr:phospholipid carrier-dependent glycosyltransferase [Myxococcales bacterium]
MSTSHEERGPPGRSNRAATLCAGAVLALLTAALVWEASLERNAWLDEPEWVTAGYRTFELVRDLSPPLRWEGAYHELNLRDWGNKNPPVGKLLIGAAVAPFREGEEPIRFMWEWPFDYQSNLAAGNIPPFRLLTPARVTVAFFGGLTLLLSYLCAVRLLERRWLAILAPVLLWSLMAFETHSTRVFTDIPQLALLLAAVAAFQKHLASGRAAYFWSSLALMGLSCAVKFSSGPLVVATAAFCLLARRQPPGKRLWRALAVMLVPFAVFVAVNPYLYPDPIGRTVGLIRVWSVSKKLQQGVPAVAPEAVKSPGRKLALVTAKAVLRPEHSDWVAHSLDSGRLWLWGLAGLAAVAALLRFRIRLGATRARLAAALGTSVAAVALAFLLGAPGILLPALAGAGLLHLARTSRSLWRSGSGLGAVGYQLLVALCFFVFTAVWLPFDWTRYYLPVLVLMPVVYVAGAAELGGLIDARRRAPPVQP